MSAKRWPLAIALVLLALSLFSSLSAQEEPSALVGSWVGYLEVGGRRLALVLNVAWGPGGLAATLDSPDQGARGIAVSSISLTGARVSFESKQIRGSFLGEMSADGSAMRGTWSQGAASLPLALERGTYAPALRRPQEPKPPFPYKVEEVAFRNEAAGIALAGTLVVPAGAGPFPAAVFVSGSGPQDRNEELLGHKPFLVLADYLARRGVASLRYDDRGTGASGGDFGRATTLDFAGDAEAAFEYLASRPEARRGAVGIIGHSEGALIAPIVASRNAGVAFAVLLAGPGLKGEELLLLQCRLVARAAGVGAAEADAVVEQNRVLYGIAREPGDGAEIVARAKGAYLRMLDEDRVLKPEDKERSRRAADELLAPLATPWFRAYLDLDPAAYLAATKVPVLALYGSKDLQVPAKENLAAVRGAFGPKPPRGTKLLELRGLNHLFQRAKTGSPEEYGAIEQTFAPEALKAVGDWILSIN